MDYDVDFVRAHFPALVDGTAFFDGPGGSQVPREVADAVGATLAGGLSNRGRATASARRADDVVLAARAAMADLVGGSPDGVVFGRSMTALTYELSHSLSRTWAPGDEVVVTRLDHDANIRPWVSAAERVGAVVRWVDVDPASGGLAFEPGLLSERTRLVAVTGASNLIGSRPDLGAVASLTHDAGALLFVDGVHLTPHAPVDVRAIRADFYACSPYKFFGPHLGVLVADPGRWEQVHPDKLEPSSDAVPERFELGTLPYELLAGTTAAVDFVADLASEAPNRRDRVLESMTAVEAYEDVLFARLLAGLDDLPGVTRYGRPARRTPTVLFDVAGHSGAQVSEHLAALGVNAPAGSFYALEASRRLGLGEAGAVRAGLAPYSSDADVDRLLAGVAELADRPR